MDWYYDNLGVKYSAIFRGLYVIVKEHHNNLIWYFNQGEMTFVKLFGGMGSTGRWFSDTFLFCWKSGKTWSKKGHSKLAAEPSNRSTSLELASTVCGDVRWYIRRTSFFMAMLLAILRYFNLISSSYNNYIKKLAFRICSQRRYRISWGFLVVGLI